MRANLLVASCAPDGAHRWSHGFPTGTDVTPSDVITDAAGNVYVTGRFSSGGGIISLSSALGGATLPNRGASDIFLASFTSEGVHWASRAYGSIGLDAGYGLVADTHGGLLLSGSFGGVGNTLSDNPTIDFGSGPLANRSGADASLARLVL